MGKKKESEFNDCWNMIFERFDILSEIRDHGYCDMLADDMKKIKEPRLLAKQDHRNNRPKVFVENELNILPLSRGVYRIAPMELYHNIEIDWNRASDDVRIFKPSDLESIDFNNITSETIAVKSIYCTRILQDFIGDSHLQDTVSGRMRSGTFGFSVNGLPKHDASKLFIDNAQMEIDAGYEGENSLVLIEAKRNLADDFLIRQLYYPYRCWTQKISKRVRPVFFIYNNGIYHLMEYEFTDLNCYNSLKLINYRKYRIIEDEHITEELLYSISHKVHIVTEPDVPFPQADSIERVINLCERMATLEEPMSKEDIWQYFSFTDRQADYYANAGIYLGLIKKVDVGTYQLSDVGYRLFDGTLTFVQKHTKIVEQILCHDVFNDCFMLRLRERHDLESKRYESILREHKECKLTENLYGRRSSTVKHWIHWIFNLIEDDNVLII